MSKQQSQFKQGRAGPLVALWQAARARRGAWGEGRRAWRGYLIAVVAVVAAAGLTKALQTLLSVENSAIVYLVPVLLSAVLEGLGPSIAAAVLSVLVYDFFFVRPLYGLSVASPQDVLDLVIFLAVAIITSNLAVRVQTEAESARRRERRTAALHAFSQRVAGAAGLDEVLRVIVDQVSNTFTVPVVLLLPADGQLVVQAAYPPGTALDERAQAAATWAWSHNRQAGEGATTLTDAEWLYQPLATAQATIGVLAIHFGAQNSPVSGSQRRLVEAFANQAAVAIERANLVRDMAQARLLTETERLRNALLSSISHDLRTPLASIIGAVTSLLTYGADYDEAACRDLQLTIQEEAERLNRYVGNLLDMTRLETGALNLNRQWVELGDIIGAALARLKPVLAKHPLEVKIEPNLPLLSVDFVLIEQVLINLLENAAKHSPAGTPIAVHAAAHDCVVALEIADEGVGIPPEDLEHVFDKFYRVRHKDYQSAGTGLGLSICKGFVEAHGGQIEARPNPAGRGSVFAITLPVSETPVLVEEGEDQRD